MRQVGTTSIYSVHELDIKQILDGVSRIKRKPGNPGRKEKPRILDIVTAFDIETTYLREIGHSFMYVWQFQLGSYTIMGRTWDEFIELLKIIKSAIKDNERMVCYIHNAEFEFQFIRGIYPFKKKEVFCMDRRKVVRFEMFQAVEFRCSYIHSNMSLDAFTKKMGCQTKKLTGKFDYTKIRYPWTELDDNEILYCINDVISLVEAIQIEMAVDGDTLETIPLTSTGYVRRKCKEAMLKKPCFHSYLNDQLPDYNFYLALREAFRGGNTHGNRYMVGQILKNVHSVDRSSSYPDVLVNHEYPVSGFVHRGALTMERFKMNTDQMHRAMIIRVALFDVQLKNRYDGCPYLSKDKCRLIQGGYFDNGRVLYARYLETTVTDIDWTIIEETYQFSNPCIYDSWAARYGKLPREFVDVINFMYREKTRLKGGDEDQRIYYDKFKNMINSLY